MSRKKITNDRLDNILKLEYDDYLNSTEQGQRTLDGFSSQLKARHYEFKDFTTKQVSNKINDKRKIEGVENWKNLNK